MKVLSIPALLALGTVLFILSSRPSSNFRLAGSRIVRCMAPMHIGGSESDPNAYLACRFNYTLPTFDGKHIEVCDTSICSGNDKVVVMKDPKDKERRWSQANEDKYTEMIKADEIFGWLNSKHVKYVKAFTEFQHSMGVYGSVAELGVYNGKFLLPISGYAYKSEPFIALDLFALVAAGKDKLNITKGHMSTTGIPHEQLRVIQADSMKLTAANIIGLGVPAVRMFSVDGGHTLEIALHDMQLASCVVRDGGIIIMDDIYSQAWWGVAEALFHFSFSQSRLVPILLGQNKAYFTTISHAKRYKDHIAKNNATFGCWAVTPEQVTMAGTTFCYTG